MRGLGHYEEKSEEDNEFYRECAKFCITAIQKISNHNLRRLNEILFVCLEVGKKWEELSFRSKQAYIYDPTFSSALAFRAKSLFMRGDFCEKENDNFTAKGLYNGAKDAAEELLALFSNTKEFESLYTAHFLLSRYYSKMNIFDKAMEHIKSAVSNARKGYIDWIHYEYDLYEKDFMNIKKTSEFKKEIAKMKKLLPTKKQKQ